MRTTCNIYVRTERSGQRVMASVVDFIGRRLRLKVNAAKSAVARPRDRHFLGFTPSARAEGWARGGAAVEANERTHQATHRGVNTENDGAGA